MVATYPILSLLVVLALSILLIRVGSVALRMTGLSPDVASFQATSAFTGAGFTTSEAEHTVDTPERRALIKTLIRLGNVGLVSAVASLVLSFTAGTENLRSLATIAVGVLVVLVLARSALLNRLVTPIIELLLARTTDLELADYTRVLGLQREYRIAEVNVHAGDWLADATPRSVELGEEGVLLLGIRRGDAYIGAPGPDTDILPGDTLVLYGREDRLQELAGRTAEDSAVHESAVAEQETMLEEQAELIREL